MYQFKANGGFGMMHQATQRELRESTTSILPRDLAMQGQIYIQRSQPAPKVGEWMDFYDKKTGDKKYGQVQKYDGKSITFKPKTGGAQKFICRWV